MQVRVLGHTGAWSNRKVKTHSVSGRSWEPRDLEGWLLLKSFSLCLHVLLWWPLKLYLRWWPLICYLCSNLLELCFGGTRHKTQGTTHFHLQPMTSFFLFPSQIRSCCVDQSSSCTRLFNARITSAHLCTQPKFPPYTDANHVT